MKLFKQPDFEVIRFVTGRIMNDTSDYIEEDTEAPLPENQLPMA